MTRSVELMSLDRSNGKALNASHSHAESEKLERKCLSRATRTDDIEIGVLMLFGVKEVNHAKRIVVPVDSEKYTRIV